MSYPQCDWFVDPGVRGTGVACFVDRVLVRLFVVRADSIVTAIAEADAYRRGGHFDPPIIVGGTGIRIFDRFTCTIEHPMIYPVKKQKGDPNDVLSVATVAGAYAGLFASFNHDVVLVRPHEWKRQLPKEIVHERVFHTEGLIRESERRICEDVRASVGKKLAENAFDAFAMGLERLGRLTLY